MPRPASRRAPARSKTAPAPGPRAKALPRPAAALPAPTLAHLEISEATLDALAILADAQETARRLATLLRGGLEPRDLPDAQGDALSLTLCLDQLGGELGRCCYQLTGLGGPGARSLVVNALDLAAVVAGLRAELRPEGDTEERSVQAQLAANAARHFGRSAQGGA